MPVPSFSSVLTTDTPNAGRVKWNSGISDIISNGVFLTPGSAQSGSIWISGSITAGSVVLPAQAAHSFFAGPTTGTAAPTFRAIDASDLPATSLIGTIADTQVAFGDSSGHISGSANFVWLGNSLEVKPVFPVGGGQTALKIAPSGSSNVSNFLIDALWNSVSQFSVTRAGYLTMKGTLDIGAGTKHSWISGNGGGALINPGLGRSAGSMYVTDDDSITTTTPHGVLNVFRIGPVPYDAADQLKSIAGSFSHDASVTPQPDTMTGIWGLLDLGLKAAGTNYPNYAGGITGTVSSHATGTIPLMIGVEGQVQHYGAGATGTITFGASLYARAPRNMDSATGTFTYAYGLYVEDTALGTTERAAIRLQTEGRISWNNDVSVHRSSAGVLSFTGALDISSNVEARGYMSLWGTTFIRSNGVVLNKAADNFLPFWTRDTTGSEVVYDLATVGNVTLTSGKYVTNAFISGEFGSGYRLDNSVSISGQSFMEIDNLVVRGTMRVNVFEKGVIKAVSGGVFISSASSTVSFDWTLGGTTGTIEEFVCQDNAFYERDVVQYKDITITGGLTVTSAFMELLTQADIDGYDSGHTQGEAVTGGFHFYAYNKNNSSGTLRAGGTIVQVGNATNVTRQAGLFLTANDGSGNVPYIDAYDGRTSYVTVTPKARLGKLTGIFDPAFGTLIGYGLYSQNAYLTGDARVAGTITAGVSGIIGTTFYAGKIALNLLTFPSEAFATWSDPGSSGITVTDNNTFAPDAKTTASRWVRSGGTNPYRYNTTTTAAGTSTFTISFWARGASGGENLVAYAARITDGVHIVDVNVTLTTSWQRYTATGTANGTNPSSAVFALFMQNTDPSTIYLWGAQLEYGIYASNYQPTDGSATYAGSEFFGMWAVAGGFGGTLQNPTVQLGSYGMKVTSGGVSTALAASSIMIGKITGTANSAIKIANTGTSGTSGLFGYTGGGAESFALRLDGSASIAGWAFTSTLLSKTVLAGDWARLMEFDSSNLRISIKLYDTNVNDNGGMASMGIDPKTGTDIGFWAGTVNIAGVPTTDWFYFRQPLSAPASPTAFIAGWSFDATKVYKSNAVLSSTGYVSFGSTPPTAYGNNVGAWLGDASGTAKLSLYASSTNYLQWDGASLTGVGGTIGTGPTGVSRIQLRGSISALEFVIASAGTDVDTATFKPIDTGGGVIGVHLEGTSALPVLLIAGTFPLASDTETYSLLSGNVIAAFDRESGVNHNVKLLGWESGVSSPSLQIDNTRVVRNRQTGWGAPTATLSRTALTNSSTTTDVLQHLAALVTDLTSHGLIGA